MEEDIMSRGKVIPCKEEGSQKDVEIGMYAEVITSKGRRLYTQNGLVTLDVDEDVLGVSPKKPKEDPAIYNPENLQEGTEELHSLHMDLEKDIREGRITRAKARELISGFGLPVGKCKTADQWRLDKAIRQDQISEVLDEERFNYLRTKPHALMTKEEWELVHDTITFEDVAELEGSEIELAYDSVVEELSEIFLKKNADYGNSFEKSLDKRGLVPAIMRMEEKMERMDNLWETNKSLVDDESILDSAMDLANYAIMTAMWLKKIVPGLSENDEK